MYKPPRKSGPRFRKPAYTGKVRFVVGDTVRVLSGRDKGKEGKITEVHPGVGKVVVEGINIVIKHKKAQPQATPSVAQQASGRIEITTPISVAKVQLVVESKGKSFLTRIGVKKDAKGNLVRVARKTGSVITQ
jgi:large subunit ribosomal protein L24